MNGGIAILLTIPMNRLVDIVDIHHLLSSKLVAAFKQSRRMKFNPPLLQRNNKTACSTELGCKK